MKKILFTFIIMVALVSCTQTNPTLTLSIPTPTIVTPTVTTEPLYGGVYNTEIITKDNIERLELLDRWGMGYVYDVNISPDGEMIAVSTSTGVYLYDFDTLEVRLFEKPTSPYYKDIEIEKPPAAIAFSPDSKYLAIAREHIALWNIDDGIIEKTIMNVMIGFRIMRMEFSQDGKQIITRGSGGSTPEFDGFGRNFQIIDIMENRLLYHKIFYYFPNGDGTASFYKTTTDGNVFFSGFKYLEDDYAYEVTIVEQSTGNILQTITFESQQIPYDISPDGSILALKKSTSEDTNTYLIDVKTQEVIKELEGTIHFLVDSDNYLYKSETSTGNWELVDKDNKIVCEFIDGEDRLEGWRFSIQGDYLFTYSSFRRNLEVWNAADCSLVHNITYRIGNGEISFNLDEKTLTTEELNYYFSVWDMTSGEVVEFNETVRGFDECDDPWCSSDWYIYSPNKKIVASNESDMITFWNSTTGERLGEYKGLEFIYIFENSFNPDSSIFAFVQYSDFDLYSESEVVFFDIETMTIQNKLITQNIHLEIISPNWRYLATTFFDDTHIYIWDIGKGEVVHKLLGHKKINDRFSFADDILFSPDSSLLLSRGDNTIRFWEVETGKFLGEITPQFAIYNIAFSPDMRLLVTTGDDGTIRIWGIPEEE